MPPFAGRSASSRPLPGLAVVLLACSILGAPGCYLHRSPESLRIAIAVPELPDALDPHFDDRVGTRYVHPAIFDALTVVDERGGLKPALATSWQPIGPTTWEFKLRQGVRFQTGEELTASTVVANVRRVLRPDLHSPVLKQVPALARANPRDRYTVLISTRRPDPILPRRLSTLYMVPTEHLQRVGEERFAREPVGTGPWQVAAFTPGGQITLEARKGSWRGAPQVRFIELKLVPREAERVEALLDGTVNVAFDIAFDQADTLIERGFQVQEIPVAAARVIVLDTAAEEAPLANVKIRQALNYAVNKDYLVDAVVGGGLRLDGQVVGKEANGYSDKLRTTYPYNPAEAQRLMAEAGFPNGFPLRIYFTDSPDQRERREISAIANDLAKIRVRVSAIGNERSAHLQGRQSGALSPTFYETLPYYPTLDASASMDVFGLEPNQPFSPTYDNDDFEEIYKLSRTETNTALRLQSLQVAMGILSEFPPAIFLYQPVRMHALQKGIADLRAHPNLLFDFDRLSR